MSVRKIKTNLKFDRTSTGKSTLEWICISSLKEQNDTDSANFQYTSYFWPMVLVLSVKKRFCEIQQFHFLVKTHEIREKGYRTKFFISKKSTNFWWLFFHRNYIFLFINKKILRTKLFIWRRYTNLLHSTFWSDTQFSF